jgi:hypothetical protein
MSKWSLLNPFRVRDAARRIRETAGGGGPKAIRLAGISHPQGWIVPTARVTIEVVAKDGTVTRFEPALPVPFPYAWTYRLARLLHVPLISRVNAERINVEFPIPGR